MQRLGDQMQILAQDNERLIAQSTSQPQTQPGKAAQVGDSQAKGLCILYQAVLCLIGEMTLLCKQCESGTTCLSYIAAI